uniref:G-protein coupled receptors family 1 profile domain-containing protein n=1 Tax=Sarcophilus harrisii TaxID=9305 RepID=A0A7N4NLX1_SARHA
MEPDHKLILLNHTSLTLDPSSGPGPFVLLGIPGLEAAHVWLSVPVCLLYLAAVIGNSLMLVLVAADPALQAPMYQLLGLLAAADLVLSTATVPKALAVLWGFSGEISFRACLAQLFFAHVAFVAESSLLLTMAVDRYLAICRPLHYGTLLTPRVVGAAGVIALVRGTCVMAPPVVLLQQLPYCGRKNDSFFHMLLGQHIRPGTA